MLERIWNVVKEFFSRQKKTSFIEQHLFYLFILGLVVVLILVVALLIKTQKEIKQQRKEDRKRGKSLMKFLSSKNNKTY